MKLRKVQRRTRDSTMHGTFTSALSYNEAFLNHPEGTFPMLVLSEVESFIVMMKELRQRIGMENWDRSTARLLVAY